MRLLNQHVCYQEEPARATWRSRHLIITFTYLILTLTSFAAWAANPYNTESFHKANQAYQAGEFDRAANEYEKILKNGGTSSEIYANLGRTQYRQGKLGQAIFNLQKAARLSPRNSEIKSDLVFLKKQTTDKIGPEQQNFISNLFNHFSKKINVKEFWWFFIFSMFAFWGFMAARLYLPKKWITYSVIVSAILLLGTTTSLIQAELLTKPFGVITASEADIYSGPNTENIVLFKLHEGTEFTVKEIDQNNWLKIGLADGKTGWVEDSLTVYEKQ